MHFEKENRVSHPAEVLLETMIDRMEAIVPFLPSVESIETKEREDREDGTIRIVRYWQGTSDSAPPAVRPFVSREQLGWTDEAIWYPTEFKVDYTLSTSMSHLYECGGTNYFEPDPDDPEGATLVRVTGDLTVFPNKLPGVPKFLGKKLAPQIEKFVVNLITPNLTDLGKGLQGYLDEQQK
ncbi:MAG: hypothetical protein ACQEXJ_24415 [Myxococcota bacterium]